MTYLLGGLFTTHKKKKKEHSLLSPLYHITNIGSNICSGLLIWKKNHDKNQVSAVGAFSTNQQIEGEKVNIVNVT